MNDIILVAIGSICPIVFFVACYFTDQDQNKSLEHGLNRLQERLAYMEDINNIEESLEKMLNLIDKQNAILENVKSGLPT